MTRQSVVLGVDSSTQSTKVVVVDAATGQGLAVGRAPHTGESVQDPSAWWVALRQAVAQVMSPDLEVLGISIAAQQHGLVTLDVTGEVVRSAPLWNNTDAAPDAARLNQQADFARLVGMRLVASVTVAKLAHMARVYPADLTRTAMVCLPHDFLTFRLTGNLVSDRGDASGTGWWSPIEERTMPELIELAVGSNVARELVTPDVLGPDSVAGKVTASAGDFLGLPAGIPVAAGSGDNPAAALGVGATEDHLVVSLGTSGTAYAVSPVPTQDPTGEVAGFADATGRFLPLSCMLNCTRVVDVIARPFGLGSVEALDLAGNEEPGAGGLFFLPYLAGERTPDLPDSRGELRGISMENVEPSRFVRAAVDGVAAGLAYCAEALADAGIRAPRIVLVGGGSQHATWQQSIADATGLPVEVRGGDEHVARGAAIQAMAATGSDTVLKVVDQWRPETLVRVEPRNEYREAFQLDRRRQIIESMKSANSTGI